MLYVEQGGPEASLQAEELRAGLYAALDALGPRRRVLVVPPDLSRLHSRAGELTRMVWTYYGPALTDILPALGTHRPMTADERARMYPGVPDALFRVHDWRRGIVTLGEVPAEFVRGVSGGVVDYPWPAQVARLVQEGGHDLILSIGQVVPHEVVGMANHSKNLFVGAGGPEGINKSHFLGAAYGMERIMGRADTPVRRVLDEAARRYARDWPLVYVHTVIGRDADGRQHVRGLFIGPDPDVFTRAAELSQRVNITLLDRPLPKVVVRLDPDEFKSTWLGNKSIYRTRMALADGGELIVLAPGVREFGEDAEIDRLIRKYGYCGTPAALERVREPELGANLSAAAHLIHGSSEGRFSITYCTGGLSRAEIEGVGYRYGELAAMERRYPPARMRDGWNRMPDGEEVYYIAQPGLGLWADRTRFEASAGPARPEQEKGRR